MLLNDGLIFKIVEMVTFHERYVPVYSVKRIINLNKCRRSNETITNCSVVLFTKTLTTIHLKRYKVHY